MFRAIKLDSFNFLSHMPERLKKYLHKYNFTDSYEVNTGALILWDFWK
jgi:hypothetical protein